MSKIQSTRGVTDNCVIDAGVCPGERELDLPTIDEREVERSARIHKALSDPTRLKIIAYLEAGELCVCELIEALDKPQPTVSHHLFLLQAAGLIESRRQGRWILYSLNEEALVGFSLFPGRP